MTTARGSVPRPPGRQVGRPVERLSRVAQKHKRTGLQLSPESPNAIVHSVKAMSRGNREKRHGVAVLELRNTIVRVVLNDAGIERPIESQSRLAQEIAGATHAVSRHFLGQLSRHCNMLAAAVADALDGLARLEPSLAFSGVVVARGLLEGAADLYWLSDRGIDRVERARRTFLVFLRQHESQVREIVHYSRRLPPGSESEFAKLSIVVAEGWESLRQPAEEMASAGYELRTSSRPGSKYSVGAPKPPVGELVDRLISAHLGTTAIPIYSLYLSVAHAEGEGLGSLRVMDDTVETPDGTRYLRGFDAAMWQQRVLEPATRGAAGALSAWVTLAYPKLRHSGREQRQPMAGSRVSSAREPRQRQPQEPAHHCTTVRKPHPSPA